MKFPERYSPNFENKIYDMWESKKAFKADEKSSKKKFCILLPPPNVTGFLHLGHALNQSIQDCLIRWKRMKGFEALWIPGTDHAGIATQAVVEKELSKKGIKRLDLGREKFLEKVWDWKNEYGNRIVNQMKKLGSSCDWDRLVFTLDEEVSLAVKEVFVSLYKKGWIYKGKRLINWSPSLRSAISDLEVEHKETKGHLWHIKYFLEGEKDFIVVATTRPETLLGDTAVAVHPEDDRYKAFIGKQVTLPLTKRKIPIVADSYVDKSFGSGVVKITPGHDFNDYEVGKRNDLKIINILNEDGTLNKNGDPYEGLSVKEARKKILSDLRDSDLIFKEEEHIHSVGYCSRTGCVIEPFLSEQWFVKIKKISEKASQVAKRKKVSFVPSIWEKTYLHWMDKVEDWCISRQLWWGHRIPAWTCQSCREIFVERKEPKECKKCKKKDLKQDEDVLDTWFSSGLWPFSTLGWPEKTRSLKAFYPSDVLVTAHDIIFFWVARMLMMGMEFQNEVPFKEVYIHGLVRDSKGRKMSKSLGNSVDPVEVIQTYGADSLRFTLLSQVATGKDIKFSDSKIESSRNFMNKVWNATKFSLQVLEDLDESTLGFYKSLEKKPFHKLYKGSKTPIFYINMRMLIELEKCCEEMNSLLDSYRFHESCERIRSFIWDEFCYWYLESIKSTIYGEDSEDKRWTKAILLYVLEKSLALLHPFAPFLTENLYQHLPVKKDLIMQESYPEITSYISFLKKQRKSDVFFYLPQEIVTAVRTVRSENGINMKTIIPEIFVSCEDEELHIFRDFICDLAKIDPKGFHFEKPKTTEKSAVTVVKGFQVVIPIQGLVNFDDEIKRLERKIKKLEDEKNKLEQKISNKNFLERATPEVVEKFKKNLEGIKFEIKELQESLRRLN